MTSQVSDESLATMQAMGFKHKDACRALRFSSNNVESAIVFLDEQKQQKKVCCEPTSFAAMHGRSLQPPQFAYVSGMAPWPEGL